MASIGELLRQARQEKGVSLGQAEEDTKVRAKYLAALEEDNFDSIPGQAYVKGFIKIYAAYLGLNSEEILMEFKSGSKEKDKPQERKERKTESRKYPGPGKLNRRKVNQKWRTYAFTAVLAVAAIATLVFVNGNWNQDRISQGEDEPNQGQVEPKPQDEMPDQNNAEVPNDSGDNQANNGNPTGNQPNNTGAENEAQNIEGVQVVLKIKDQDSWVKVVADDQPIFTGTLTPGQERSFDAKEKIGLVLGNAGAVEVTYNGQTLGSLGPIGKVVREEFKKSM